MAWQLLLIGYLAAGTATYLYRRSLARMFAQHNRLVNAFFFVAVLFPTGLLVAAIESPSLAIGWTSMLFLAAGSIVFPLANLLLYRANRDIDAGMTTVISNLIPVVSITAAWLLLNEGLTPRQLAGAAIILLAAILVISPQLRHHMVHSRIALVYAVIGVTLVGLGFVFERFMLTRMDFGAYLVFGWGMQMAWSVLFAWPERRSIKVLRDRKLRMPLLGYSIGAALRGLCFVGALKLSGNASVVVAGASFLTVIVVLSAYFILKETDWLWLKLGAGSIGVAGLLLLNL